MKHSIKRPISYVVICMLRMLSNYVINLGGEAIALLYSIKPGYLFATITAKGRAQCCQSYVTV